IVNIFLAREESDLNKSGTSESFAEDFCVVWPAEGDKPIFSDSWRRDPVAAGEFFLFLRRLKDALKAAEVTSFRFYPGERAFYTVRGTVGRGVPPFGEWVRRAVARKFLELDAIPLDPPSAQTFEEV